MKTEAWTFGGVSATLFTFAISYAIWRDVAIGAVDWVGVIMLGMGGALCAMIGLYFGAVARRIQARPEDRPHAEIADGAGEVGFLSPGSYWPVALAGATAVAAIGLVHQAVWLITAGIIAILRTASGLMFEYHTGTRRVEPAPPQETTAPSTASLPRAGPPESHPDRAPPTRTAVPAGPQHRA